MIVYHVRFLQRGPTTNLENLAIATWRTATLSLAAPWASCHPEVLSLVRPLLEYGHQVYTDAQ